MAPEADLMVRGACRKNEAPSNICEAGNVIVVGVCIVQVPREPGVDSRMISQGVVPATVIVFAIVQGFSRVPHSAGASQPPLKGSADSGAILIVPASTPEIVVVASISSKNIDNGI